jgi:hypothetical protein
LNTEFPGIDIRVIASINDLRTSEKHLVQAIARNFADACLRNGIVYVANNAIQCNVAGILAWIETLSPWKNRTDQSIQDMTQRGNITYTNYNIKIMPIVFGNTTWASGATNGAPSTWGNYQHRESNASAPLVNSVIIPMIDEEFARNPRNVTQIDFISVLSPRELAVYVGQPASVLVRTGNQVYHAKEIFGPFGCIYSFVTTVISPSNLGTLGICD